MKLKQWLEETKKLNLRLKELAEYIDDGKKTHFFDVYEKLEGEFPTNKAIILYKKWNSERVNNTSSIITTCL